MTVNNEALLNLTAMGNTLTRCNGGFRVSLDYLHGVDGDFVSDAFIASIHPRLPAAIRLLIAKSPLHRACASTLDILKMFELWECAFFFQSKEGLAIAGSAIHNVSLYETRVDIVLDGYRYEKQQTVYEAEPFLIPSYPCSEVAISNAWLDENQPQWCERYLLAKELGYDPDSCFRAMFNMFKLSPCVEIPSNIAI